MPKKLKIVEAPANSKYKKLKILEKSDDEIIKYIKTLSIQELLVLKIAEEHLETSFDIKSSIGFIKWKNNN
jgi:hypothetical protein